MDSDVIVVGGGAAGMMAAITAARSGASVLLFEKNSYCGRKLGITGKGRCNLTNDCTEQEFLSNVPTNPRFLYAAISGFGTQDTKDFFEAEGVKLKTERGKRVFPVSDKAREIVDALTSAMKRSGVKVVNQAVSSVNVSDNIVTGVTAGGKEYTSRAVIMCTGGKSYPQTGSDGSGHIMVGKLGHKITPLRPSLVPIVGDADFCRSMQGLSLKNVGLKICNANGKTVYEDFGEMMFTHFGLTGPMILSASAHIQDIQPEKYHALIDMKPALDEKTLDARLLSDFSKYSNKDFVNSLADLLPSKMIEPFIARTGIDPRKKVNLITKEERRKVVSELKSMRIELSRFRPISEAIVTSGGVDVREINPKTMESKLIRGLYFAGEIIDVDAYTGGFNLQIAWSTGVAAGSAASNS